MAYVPLAQVSFTGDGSTLDYSYAAIQGMLLNATVPHSTQLVVSVDGVVQTLTTDYTVNVTLEEVNFVTAPADTKAILIARVTQNNKRYVDFTDGSVTTEADLNLDSDQLLFISQEALDDANLSMIQNSTGNWDGQFKRIEDLLPGTNPSDAVTKSQMEAAIGGGSVADLNDGVEFQYKATAGQTNFVLTNVSGVTTAQLSVWVNNVIQPAADWTTPTPVTIWSITSGSTSDTLVFAAGLNLDDEVLIKGNKGVVLSTITNNSVATASLQNSSVTTAKLASDAVTKDKILNATITEGKMAVDNSPVEYIGAAVPTTQNTQLLVYDESTGAPKVSRLRLHQINPPTHSLAMWNQKITGLAAGTINGDAVRYEQLTAVGAFWTGTTSTITMPAGNTWSTPVVINAPTGNTKNIINVTVAGTCVFSGTPYNDLFSVTIALNGTTTVGGTNATFYQSTNGNNFTHLIVETTAVSGTPNSVSLRFKSTIGGAGTITSITSPRITVQTEG